MSSKEVILKAVNTLPPDRVFTRNDLFQMVSDFVKSSTFSFYLNKILVGEKIELVGKCSGSKTQLYKRKF